MERRSPPLPEQSVVRLRFWRPNFSSLQMSTLALIAFATAFLIRQTVTTITQKTKDKVPEHDE
jgi:hypothetical protein